MTTAEPAVYLMLSTVPVEDAAPLADQLLQEKLVACVNCLGPAQSRYLWEGKIESSEETLLLMKTTAAGRAKLRQRLAELHSYDVPEVLEFAADGGLPAYLAWVDASVS